MPSAVGVLLAFVHPAWLLGFDALTFALSAALIAGIVPADVRRRRASARP